MTRVGLVLGAGGSVGYAFHCGVLAALDDVLGFDARDADLLVGTSAGSVAAVFLTGGLPPGDFASSALGRPLSDEGRRVLDRLERPVTERGDGDGADGDAPSATSAGTGDGTSDGRGEPASDDGGGYRPAAPGLLARVALRPWRYRAGVVGAAALPAGDERNRDVRRYADRLLGERWPARLRVCAVRLGDGARVVFGDGDAPSATPAQAVAASCAVPSVIAPVAIDGERYVDGGVHSPTNADVAVGEVDLVVVSSPLSTVRADRRLAPDLALRTYSGWALRREVERLRDAGAEVVTVQATAEDQRGMGTSLMDGSRRKLVLRRAYESARRRLDDPDVRERLAAIAD